MVSIQQIRAAWGWCGIRPCEIVGENDFGNLIVRDESGKYWRITPEDLACSVVASDRAALDALSKSQEFLKDWYMVQLVEQARSKVGPLAPGRKYCLKIPGALGGEYGGDNLASISFGELIEVSGNIAGQIQFLPDGTKVQFRIVE